MLTYTDDSMYFAVDDMGNITTTMMLDHEAMASHTVTVTATDAEATLLRDMIAVTISGQRTWPETPDVRALMRSSSRWTRTCLWAR